MVIGPQICTYDHWPIIIGGHSFGQPREATFSSFLFPLPLRGQTAMSIGNPLGDTFPSSSHVLAGQYAVPSQ